MRVSWLAARINRSSGVHCRDPGMTVDRSAEGEPLIDPFLAKVEQ